MTEIEFEYLYLQHITIFGYEKKLRGVPNNVDTVKKYDRRNMNILNK